MANSVALSVTGEGLRKGESLYSDNGRYRLWFYEAKGDLLLRDESTGNAQLLGGDPLATNVNLTISSSSGVVIVGILGSMATIPLTGPLSEVPATIRLQDNGFCVVLGPSGDFLAILSPQPPA